MSIESRAIKVRKKEQPLTDMRGCLQNCDEMHLRAVKEGHARSHVRWANERQCDRGQYLQS